MRRYLVLLLPASLSVLVACGDGEEKPAPAARTATPVEADQAVAFKLGEENRSGSSGSATLKGGDPGFTVTLRVKRPKNSGPAYIHNVTCEQYRAMEDFDAQFATVEVALRDLADGRSKTQVDAPLSQYRTAPFSINVHSYAGEFPVVACGNIPSA
jgi:hypothetical protein